jgi:carbon storage regulator CsrA
MLVFSRNIGEDFYIGENVRVVILACDRSGRVRVGIEGPREVAIARGELVRLPRPSRVTPASLSKSIAQRGQEGGTLELPFPDGKAKG